VQKLRQIHKADVVSVTPECTSLSNVSYSSGDLIADRRADFAKTIAEGGDYRGAADIMAQALELVPHWAAGWYLLGGYCETSQDVPGAISAWRHLEALDEADVFGARLKLAAHGAGEASQGTATGYVEALFDQFAPRFETVLLDRLQYQVPDLLDRMLVEEMSRQGIDGFAHALDLGCGTGLMGERLRKKVSYLEGIDLSSAMLAATARKEIYDRLDKAELVDDLSSRQGEVDLLTAADVLIYCGALQPILAACMQALCHGGVLAFSLEAHDGPEAIFLRPSLRYAHGVAATRDALIVAGLEVLRFDYEILRYDRGEPIYGILVLARKPAVELTAANDHSGGDSDVAA
jgi:predicted TPR repeat methyltransferase